MEFNKPSRQLKNMGTYIIRALKFFDLKNEYITPVVFTVMLFFSFAGIFIPGSIEKITSDYILYNVVNLVVMYIASSIYLYAYICELRKKEYTFKGCVRWVIKRWVKILAVSIVYILAIASGTLLLIVPGIIIYLMFIFNICYIVDKDKGVIEAFSASKRITDGRKAAIFGIVLMFTFILVIPLYLLFMIIIPISNNLMFAFAFSFMSIAINLMQQRLIALMYTDLEYSKTDN